MRGLTQKIYLLGADFKKGKWTLEVKGTTNNIYKIILSKKKVSCSCPDFARRKELCKHFFYVTGKILSNLEITDEIETVNSIKYNIDFISESLKHILLQKDDKKTKKTENCKSDYDKNDYCCICFDELGKDVCFCTFCKKPIHNNCMKIWLRKKNNCPLCRSLWKKDKDSENETSSSDPLKYFKLKNLKWEI